jgi:DNA-3-methyladenine glycosylase I
MTETEPKVCSWATSSPAMRHYHDTEWGRPLHDERGLFEFLILEGAQAGLSWSTILNKRENYRRAFHGFDAAKIAGYGETDRTRLMADAGIVRNRLKIEAAITNAQATLRLRETHGGLDTWLWRWVDGQPVVKRWTAMGQVPARTELSDTISKALLKQGFKFVGSTIIYAFMQATGMVNDHLLSCPARHAPMSGPMNGKC